MVDPITAIGFVPSAEWLIIILIVVVLFGAKRIPELGKSVGEGIKNFRSGLKDGASSDDEDEDAHSTEPRAKAKLEAEPTDVSVVDKAKQREKTGTSASKGA